jgi:hypothetical protein
MSFQKILTEQMLSEDNISYVLNIILRKYKINNKSIPKCKSIIKQYVQKYLENLNRFPNNNDEIIEAISFLNNKCYNDFCIYLHKKFPNIIPI